MTRVLFLILSGIILLLSCLVYLPLLFGVAGSDSRNILFVILGILVSLLASLLGALFPQKWKCWAAGIICGLCLVVVGGYRDTRFWREDNQKTCRYLLENPLCTFENESVIYCKIDENSGGSYPYTLMCKQFDGLMSELEKKKKIQFTGYAGTPPPHEKDVRFTHYRAVDGQPLADSIQAALGKFAETVDDIHRNPSVPAKPDPRFRRMVLIKSCLEQLNADGKEDLEHLAYLGMGNVRGPLLETGQAYEKFRTSRPSEFHSRGPILNFFPEGRIVNACRELEIN